MLQLEFAFALPCGYQDAQGRLHRQGVMRRATALDELEPLRDPRLRGNPAYLGVLLLGRVVTQLGTMGAPGAVVIERLFAADFVYLQQLYGQINDLDSGLAETCCPECGARFTIDLAASP